MCQYFTPWRKSTHFWLVRHGFIIVVYENFLKLKFSQYFPSKAQQKYFTQTTIIRLFTGSELSTFPAGCLALRTLTSYSLHNTHSQRNFLRFCRFYVGTHVANVNTAVTGDYEQNVTGRKSCGTDIVATEDVTWRGESPTYRVRGRRGKLTPRLVHTFDNYRFPKVHMVKTNFMLENLSISQPFYSILTVADPGGRGGHGPPWSCENRS